MKTKREFINAIKYRTQFLPCMETFIGDGANSTIMCYYHGFHDKESAAKCVRAMIEKNALKICDSIDTYDCRIWITVNNPQVEGLKKIVAKVSSETIIIELS